MINDEWESESKNLTVFTLNPKGNSQIFLLTPFRDGVKQEKNRHPGIINRRNYKK